MFFAIIMVEVEKGLDPVPCKEDCMTYTEKKKQSNRKWDAQNLDRVSFTVPKGCKMLIQAAADEAGESVNQYTQGALLARMGLSEWPKRQSGRDD